MKKVLFTLIALLSIMSAIAQEGEIIYIDYEPDIFVHNGYPDTLLFDFDNDGVADIRYHFNVNSVGYWFYIDAINPNLEFTTCEENEAIPELSDWNTSLWWFDEELFGYRIKENNNYYYGWFRVYNYLPGGQLYEYVGVYFDKYAYCTVPNYPLRWGQENFLQVSDHYDFSAVCETGQTLYYRKRDTGPYNVEIVCPNGNTWAPFDEPKGDIILPASVQKYGITYMVEAIADSAFYHCDSLTGDLTIPTTVKSVGSMAFYACRNFDGVLTLPNTITHIGEGAFWWCESLTGTVRFPNHLTEIDSLVLYYCHSIEAIEIPASVTHIARRSLNGSRVMTSIKVDEDNPYYYSENNALIERESKELIAGCMTTVIPDDVVSIAPSAFDYCGDGGNLVIPNSVESIGELAFRRSEFSGSLTLSENLTSIGDYAFMASRFQGELILPEGLLYLPNYTFNDMYVTSVTIPSSIQFIGAGCFWDCHISQSMKVNCVVPPELEEDSFKNVDKDIPVYIPAGTMSAYRNARYWEQFNNFVEDTCAVQGSEWYYEIENEDGSITYQHLQQEGDTVVNHKDVKIIVRTNTLYDKGSQSEVTHEYIYEENDVVYWWNEALGEFTVLYDFGAEEGNEWEIKVGTESVTVHVDAVLTQNYDGKVYKILEISDADNVFSGTIVCGIGHLTSFFPERLMNKKKAYRVEGMRCYWKEGDLVFKYGDKDCDEVYIELHNGIEETANASFSLYPNPAKGYINVETTEENADYEILNIMGQTVLSGSLNVEKQICLDGLSDGMYFIKVGRQTMKFVVGK